MNIRLGAKKLDELFQVDVNLAMKLCIESAQLYFNSSASYHDSDMKLAQECLNIVDMNLKRKFYKQLDSNYENSSLKFKSIFNQETDLISAIKIVGEFNIPSLLPIKVRSMENRFDIIKIILEKNPNAYRDHEKLINLGKFDLIIN